MDGFDVRADMALRGLVKVMVTGRNAARQVRRTETQVVAGGEQTG